MKIGRREMMSLYLDPPKKAALAKLSKQTHTPAAVLLREAVDDLLAKYKEKSK